MIQKDSEELDLVLVEIETEHAYQKRKLLELEVKIGELAELLPPKQKAS